MPNGEGYLGGGGFIRPRDWLKVGQLYLNGGVCRMVAPELDLVVVFTAGNYVHGGVWHWFRDDWLVNDIIPAIIGR